MFIAPISKTDELTAPQNLHPYVFRTASKTTIEGRRPPRSMAKWPVKRVATISPDYAYGQDVTKAFVEHIKKIKPDIEIVDQQWPKLGEADYTPFINAQMAKKPEAVFSSLWGGHFVTFVKQAKPLGYFDAIKNNFIAGGEAGSIESAKAMGDDYPVGIWGNSYDVFNWEGGPPAHKDYIDAAEEVHQGGAPVVVADPGLHRACRSWSRASRRRTAPSRTRWRRRCWASPSTRRSASRRSAPRTTRPTAASSGARR